MPAQMPPPGSPLARLFDAPIRPGRVVWIGLRPARRAAVRPVAEARLLEGRGLAGDRAAERAGGARQVTLIAAESLAAIGAFLGSGPPPPALLRRNLVIAGVNLAALKGRRFRLGNALLEWSGDCHPCSRMEEALGPGGYNAVRGLGGICARVVLGGAVAIGDALERADSDPGWPGRAGADARD